MKLPEKAPDWTTINLHEIAISEDMSSIMQKFNVVHQTARTDFLELCKAGLLKRCKQGKKHFFVAVEDLDNKPVASAMGKLYIVRFSKSLHNLSYLDIVKLSTCNNCVLVLLMDIFLEPLS